MVNLSNYWINVSNIKNYMLDDPIIDWLNLYGKDNNFQYDTKKKTYLQNILKKKQKHLGKKFMII